MKNESQTIQTFSIADVINPNLIKMEMEADSKEEAITELSELLYENQIITDLAGFTQDVFARETEGMTGIGHGLAIPHGKSDSVKKTSLVIGKTKRPLEWESIDEAPVQVIILFAVKNTDANTMHIKLLQKVAMLLADESFIDRLVASGTKDQMMALLAKDPMAEN